MNNIQSHEKLRLLTSFTLAFPFLMKEAGLQHTALLSSQKRNLKVLLEKNEERKANTPLAQSIKNISRQLQ